MICLRRWVGYVLKSEGQVRMGSSAKRNQDKLQAAFVSGKICVGTPCGRNKIQCLCYASAGCAIKPKRRRALKLFRKKVQASCLGRRSQTFCCVLHMHTLTMSPCVIISDSCGSLQRQDANLGHRKFLTSWAIAAWPF